MTVADLIAAMEKIAPTRLAEPWDNVGLIVGDSSSPVSRVLLCIDLTPAVLAEAVSLRCEAVIAYHPVIFEGVKRLGPGDIAFEAARRGIAVYCPHTALDVAEGGTNDLLASAIGLTDLRPLKHTEGKARECKLVTFAPEEAADAVAEALFAAGAGRIGAYSKCSFRSFGTGTFLGDDTTNPAVGKKGQLERQPEVKLETVVPLTKVPDVIAALRASHPYEEPAFDLVTLAAIPETLGVGRVGTMAPTPLSEVVGRLKTKLGLSHLLVAGDPQATVSRVAICAGAGRGLIGEVLKVKADLYVTGELPHHDALRLLRSGVSSFCTLHSNSERGVLKAVAEQLKDFTCLLSVNDTDPFTIS